MSAMKASKNEFGWRLSCESGLTWAQVAPGGIGRQISAEWAGAVGGGFKGGDLDLEDDSQKRSHTPSAHKVGGRINRFAHSAGLGIMEQRGNSYFLGWSAP